MHTFEKPTVAESVLVQLSRLSMGHKSRALRAFHHMSNLNPE